jgi:hypothetical protein
MDPTSHSVYLTTGQNSDGTNRAGWFGYDGHSIQDGVCTGNTLGRLPDGCHDLDNTFSSRIQCVYEG